MRSHREGSRDCSTPNIASDWAGIFDSMCAREPLGSGEWLTCGMVASTVVAVLSSTGENERVVVEGLAGADVFHGWGNGSSSSSSFGSGTEGLVTDVVMAGSGEMEGECGAATVGVKVGSSVTVGLTLVITGGTVPSVSKRPVKTEDAAGGNGA